MRKKFERSRGDLKQRTVDVHMLQVKSTGNVLQFFRMGCLRLCDCVCHTWCRSEWRSFAAASWTASPSANWRSWRGCRRRQSGVSASATVAPSSPPLRPQAAQLRQEGSCVTVVAGALASPSTPGCGRSFRRRRTRCGRCVPVETHRLPEPAAAGCRARGGGAVLCARSQTACAGGGQDEARV